MKIIDLLNKIANGEEVPKKIKYRDWLYEFEKDCNDYLCQYDSLLYRENDDVRQFLNDEVEILEEEPKVKVELTEKEYLEYLDKINKNIKSVRDYIPKPSFLKLEEEKKIPEKLPYYSMEKIQKAKNKDEWREERITLLEKRVNDLHIKMNDLLDYLKSKGE